MKVSLEEVDGNVEKMIKRFLKKTKKMRIVEGCFDRRYYIKPSAERNEERRMRQRIREKEKAEQPKED
jgi:ribosomal protein S21